MNAPEFLRRARKPVHHHPIDLDQAYEKIDHQVQQVRQRKTEAMEVGDQAEQAVIRATQLTKEIMAMIDKAKSCAVEIEREGLAFIARVQQQQEEFNRRTENFVRSATELHTGLHEVLANVGQEKEPQKVEVDPKQAQQIDEDMAEIVEFKNAERT